MMSKPRWFQVLTEENLDGYCKKHGSRNYKSIFRFESCDVVCHEGKDPYDTQPHVEATTMCDYSALVLNQISDLFDCSQIQSYFGGIEVITLRPWRDCVRTTEGCTKHVSGVNTKFCSFTCKIEHVLEREGDLSSITKLWSEDDSKPVSEHVGDLSIHPCGDPERIFPFKKRSRKRREFLISDEDIFTSY